MMLTKRILSSVLALSLLLSVLGTLSFSSVFADVSNHLDYDGPAAAGYENDYFKLPQGNVLWKPIEMKKNNLLENATVIMNTVEDNGNCKPGTYTNTATGETLSNLSGQGQYGSGEDGIQNFVTYGCANKGDLFWADAWGEGKYMDLIFKLDSYVIPEAFSMINRSEKEFQAAYYELYASYDAKDIYNESSKIATYDRSDQCGLSADQLSDRGVNLISLKNAGEIRYFRMKIKYPEPLNSTGNSLSFRAERIMLFGSKTDREVKDDDTVVSDNVSALPDKDAIHSKEVFSNCNIYNPENLEDGKKETEFSSDLRFAEWKDGKATYYDDDSLAVTVGYDLGKSTVIKKIGLTHHAILPLRTAKYELYAASDKEALYNAENKIVAYTNDLGTVRQIFTLKSDTKARYVGLKVLFPTFDKGEKYDITKLSETGDNNIYLRLTGFRVYGEAAPREDSFKNGASLKYDGPLKSFDEYFTLDGNRIVSKKDNILASKKYDIFSLDAGGNNRKLSTAGLENLVDGDASTCADFYSGEDVTFIYPLEEEYTLDTLVLIHRAELNFQTTSYAIYAAATQAGLDSESAYLGTYTYDPSIEDHRLNIIDLGNKEKIRFFKIQYLGANASFDKGFRINEIMLYGTKTGEADPYATIEDESDQVPAYESNLVLKNTAFKEKRLEQDHETVANTVYGAAGLTDGKADTEFSMPNLFAEWKDGKAVYYSDGKTVYSKIIYDFGSEADVSHIVLLNHITKSIRTGHYQLYVGNHLDTLFDKENLKADFKNEAMTRRQIFSFGEGKTARGRYVAIKIVDPVSGHGIDATTTVDEDPAHNNIYTRLLEFAVYGQYTNPDYLLEPDVEIIWEKTSGKPYFSNNDVAALGKSLIAGQTADVKLKGVKDEEDIKRSGPLTDGKTEGAVQYPVGNFSTHTDFANPTVKDGSEPLDFIYKIADGETPYDLTKFLFIGIGDCSDTYLTAEYEIYASVDYDDLFNEDSRVFYYNYDNDGAARGHIITFKPEKMPRACYVAVRVIRPVNYDATEWIYARVTEIAVYGQKANIPTTPVNLAENMPLNAYFADKAGNMTELSSKELTAAMAKTLTDDNVARTVTFSPKGKQLQLFYNLCNDASIDEIKVSGKDLKGFRIYTSTDLNKIYDESSKVYSYSKGEGSEDTNGIIFPQSKKMRYVRVVFDEADTIKISEIAVIGMDNQVLKFKNLAPTISWDKIEFFNENLKTGSITYTTGTAKQAEGLIDRDRVTGDTVWGGQDGVSSFNVMFTFSDLRNISSCDFYFLQNREEYWPQEMDLFLGETAEDVMKENAQPTYTFKSSPTNSEYHFDSVPRLVRCVRLRFKNISPKLKDIYETINIAFTEVYFNGTAVKGMQRSDDHDELLTFNDAKTGISWEVVRLDTNDIFTRIASSKLVSYKANIYEKSSLNQYPYYKIDGDKLYTIEFYDVTGKRVTDLKGREVRVKFPIKASEVNGKSVFGVTKDDRTIELSECTYETGKKSYLVGVLEDVNGIKFANTLLTSKKDTYWKNIPPAGTYSDDPSDPSYPNDPGDPSEPVNPNDPDDPYNPDSDDPINVATGESRLPLLVFAILVTSVGLVSITFKKRITK